MTLDLFSENEPFAEDYIRIDLDDAELRYYSNFMSPQAADEALLVLNNEIEWSQEYISMYGSKHPIPRLSAWYGDQGVSYEYSGIRGRERVWTPELWKLKCLVEGLTGETFNGVLVNLYRSGQDSVSWHSDDESTLGEDPIVASISLGQVRRFQLKHKRERRDTVNLSLGHGSLLLMMSGTQTNWVHQVPKTSKQIGERINLTFRRVFQNR